METYEKLKYEIVEKNLTPTEYEKAIKELAERLNV